ncbi:hypothetical protein K458DRAFT_200239 [Lentithecium fluviatile CBS 122367]|uniref:Galactose oxidase n=1 Tax=Lentithecium fluviatile CBS 122367 TaxID=1168545 RepID=A0A6G1J7S6_9PLEO|nr:hypothetical protein K458DRAFT_200239 [Lentithecium fluviatile CBS 122367]
MALSSSPLAFVRYASCLTILLAFATLFQLSRAQQISLTVNTNNLDPFNICGSTYSKMVVSNNKVYIYGGSNWFRNGTSPPYQITNTYLRIADFTSAQNMSNTLIMTALEIPDNVTIYNSGAFWGDEKWLYVVGGQTNLAPYLTQQGDFVSHNWTVFSAGTVFKYEIQSGKWSSEPTLQPTDEETAAGTFCCGSFGWNERLGRGFVFSGCDYAGATRKDPNAGCDYTGSSDVVRNSNIMVFDTAGWRWSNKSTDKRLTSVSVEFGAFVFLPGTETADGSIAILLGGIEKEPYDNMKSMRQVLVYESKTGSWYNQETTAENDFPSARHTFCAVAVSASDNSSHNIYIYGGETKDDTDGFSDMYVLSIPSFH